MDEEATAELRPDEGPRTAAVPQPGPTDSLLDVPGLAVGQLELGVAPEMPRGATGITAIVAPDGALGAVDVRGAAPATHETDALSALSSGERVHAVLLVGRSVFGLAAADGATRELEARGIGLPVERSEGRLTIPIVAGAAIFDFAHGDRDVRPGADDGRAVVAAALDGPRDVRPASGNAGAGAGATTGSIAQPRLKGGVGHASLMLSVEGGTLVVGAAAVVNSAGSLIDPVSRRPWAQWGGFHAASAAPDFSAISAARRHTTLVVVGTNARLEKAHLARVAAMAHDGLARAIRPSHSSVDGDLVIALAVPDGEGRRSVTVHEWPPAAVTTIGALAADAVARAILDALLSARSSGGFEAHRSGDATAPAPALLEDAPSAAAGS